MSNNKHGRFINFSAGPSQLPLPVLIKAQHELLNYEGSGCSVMELSHRSPQFSKVITEAEKDMRELLSVPESHVILFLQGGGTGQFASVPLNLLSNFDDVADYLVTGSWSDKAYKEATKYGKVNRVNPKTSDYSKISDPSTWNISSNAKYFYYCDNETIGGVEFPEIPSSIPSNVPIVADMSSNFMTKPIDISRYGLIFAAAQKNIGIAGLSVVIVRKDLLGKANPVTPTILDYKVMADAKSLYNTPPTFPIYMTGLYMKWMKEQGGLSVLEERCKIKSNMIYDIIDSSANFYYAPIDKSCRSRVTIPFRIGGSNGNADLETKFLKEAEKACMIQLKGHRSVGGIRVCLFNAITIEETKAIAQFMINFMQNNK